MRLPWSPGKRRQQGGGKRRPAVSEQFAIYIWLARLSRNLAAVAVAVFSLQLAT